MSIRFIEFKKWEAKQRRNQKIKKVCLAIAILAVVGWCGGVEFADKLVLGIL